jgi:phosphoribosylanthranilate isomerase
MALKIVVKVSNISNLSDARYCAGMGVDLLGFRVSPGDLNYVAPETFQEFRGWFSGPKVVAECYGIGNIAELKSVIEEYAPDFLEVSLSELQFAIEADKPIILSVNTTELEKLETAVVNSSSQIEYILLPAGSSTEQIKTTINFTRVLITIADNHPPSDVLSSVGNAAGISLSGTVEERPGLKSYEGLADILELLEIED